MPPSIAQISEALRYQIELCLGTANGFVEHPQTAIAEAKISGVAPSRMIGHVALAMAATHPIFAAKLKAIADEIDGIARAYDGDPLWKDLPIRLRHVRDLIAAVRIDHL
jgi:hypothetical protein